MTATHSSFPALRRLGHFLTGLLRRSPTRRPAKRPVPRPAPPETKEGTARTPAREGLKAERVQ